MARPEVLNTVRSTMRSRTDDGLKRVRDSIIPALQMTFCAIGAYTFAEYVLGHVGPLFAATSSLIALGFAGGARLRRVVEVGAGCTLGIAVGDLVLNWLGHGILQSALVLLSAILLARFLDRGAIFATQLGLQSLLVMLLPAPAGGPFTRSIDAVIGGIFALLVAVLTPRDPRGRPRAELQRLLQQTGAMLREAAEGIRKDDSTLAWHALVRARNAQPKVDALRLTLKESSEVTSMSPLYRRHKEEVSSMVRTVDFMDLALRNARVFTRRLTNAINHATLDDAAKVQLAQILDDTARAVDQLAEAHSPRHRTSAQAREREVAQTLAAITARVDPAGIGGGTIEGETAVMLYRPLMVDLLQAAGATEEEARAALPSL